MKRRIAVVVGVCCLLLIGVGVNRHIQTIRKNDKLVEAVFKSDIAAVHALLAEGADANVAPSSIPLLQFMVLDSVESDAQKKSAIIGELLNAGANPNVLISGDSALSGAIKACDRGVMQLLLEHNADASIGAPLIAMIGADSCEYRESDYSDLIKKGSPTDRPLVDGRNPFTFAIKEANAEAIKALDRAGAYQMIEVDGKSESPAMVATAAMYYVLRKAKEEEQQQGSVQDFERKQRLIKGFREIASYLGKAHP